MITFVVQNETHALNFAPIISDLMELGIPADKLHALHLDPICGMDTYNLISAPNQSVTDLKIPAPYYHLNRLQRFIWLLGASSQLKDRVKGTSVLVIGCDGGIQRLMANYVQAQGGKIIMLLDGLLTPWPGDRRFRHQVKKKFNRLAKLLRLNHLLPADIGHSRLNLIYVMDSTVKNILRNQGVRTPIEVVNLPRFDNYRKKFRVLSAKNNHRDRHCLYATGAYRWHGKFREAEQQEQDLVDLSQFALKRPDWIVRIRIHPRESVGDYTDRRWPDNIHLSGKQNTVLEDLAWCSVLVTRQSTVAVEAKLVGVPVLIYTRNAGKFHSDSYFDVNDYFHKSDTLSDLLSLDQLSHRLSNVEPNMESDVGEIALGIKDAYQ